MAVSALLVGCKADYDDVEAWKGTVKGPSRLMAVVGSDRYSDDLRAQAALASVEMDRSDVNGLQLLDRTLDQLSHEDAEATGTIVTAMVPRLQGLLEADATETDLQAQIRAKDAAYMLIPYAPEASRTTLTESVVGWYASDFEGRSLAGDYSAEQVTRSLGSEAAGMLVDALHEKMAPLAMIKISEIIAETGDEPTKARAAKRLVDIEKKMETREFVSWLSGEIRASLEAAGEPADDARVAPIAVYNRENYINNGVLPAMSSLADEEVISMRLMQIADTKPGPEDSAAWTERLNARRATALRALEGHVTTAQLNRLLAIALDPGNSMEVRDYAFDRVGDIRSRRAIPKLWPLVTLPGCTAASCTSDDQLNKRLRWRAGELVLMIGGDSQIEKFSEELPAADGIQYEPEELGGYATRLSQMSPPPTQTVLELLDSAHWWNRIIALRYLERRGQGEDIPTMGKLTTDTAVVAGEGWAQLNPPATQVGDVAKAAIAALQMREQGTDGE